MGVGDWYARIRSGKAFLRILILAIVVWIAWQYVPGLPHFDASWSRLDTALSIEASVSLGVTAAVMEKVDKMRERHEAQADALRKNILSLLQAQIVTDELLVAQGRRIEDAISGIEEMLSESRGLRAAQEGTGDGHGILASGNPPSTG